MWWLLWLFYFNCSIVINSTGTTLFLYLPVAQNKPMSKQMRKCFTCVFATLAVTFIVFSLDICELPPFLYESRVFSLYRTYTGLVFKLLVCSHCFIGWQQVNNSWKNNSLEFNQNCKHLAASTSMVMPSDCLNIIHNEWMFHREQGPDIFLLWSVWNAPGIFASMAQLACATCMKRQIVISWEMQHSLLSICLEASFVI